MASLTVKQIDDRLLDLLRDQAKRRSQSLNTFVRELLARAVGFVPGVRTYDDLSDLAGSWTDDDVRELEDNTRPFREIDESLWA
jgi:plasmid stability protein